MDKFSLIKQFSRKLTSTLELKELADVINSFAVAELGAENSSIILSDRTKFAVRRERILDDIEEVTFKYAIKVRKTISISNPGGEYMLKDIEGIGSFEPIVVAIPLVTKNQALGVLNLYFRNKISDDLAEFLDLFTELSSSSIMNSLSYRNLEQVSVTDKLTGLRNRRSFDSSVEEAIEKCSSEKTPVSVMMIDIDNFKEYNDEKGHQKGDEALRLIGKSLISSLPEGANAFRYGGEELAVVIPKLEPKDAFESAEKIRNNIEQSCGITVSIGMATCVNSSCRASAMIKEADSSLYKAKKAGKNRVSSSVILDKALNPIDVQAASELGKKR